MLIVAVLFSLQVAQSARRRRDVVANARALLNGCPSATDAQRTNLNAALNAYSDAPGPGTLSALRTALNAFECTTPTPGVSGRKRPPYIYVLLGMVVLGVLFFFMRARNGER